ncbi:class I SAM-dependent methyltransferase [Bacteroidota bacterium]
MNHKAEKNAEKINYTQEEYMDNLMKEKDIRMHTLRTKDSIAYLLNARTLDILKPLLKKKNTWLTIGDYNGFEAKYLKEHNQLVTASDISSAFLNEAKSEGFIDDFRKENVENISLKEDSIDYLSCREAFHHFPRAYLGVYEMIRVSKKGTILIEPVDVLSKMPLLLLLKNVCDLFDPQLINKIWKNRFSWETVGNYVFKISEREIEKIAMGINLPCIAFKEINFLMNIKDDTSEVPVNKKLLKKINRKYKNEIFCVESG